MGVFKKIGEFFAGGAMEVAKDGAEIVEKWFPGAEKKAEIAADIDNRIAASQDSARQHDSKIGNVPGLFNDIVNAINRLIRPGVTIGLLGGVVGFWELPATGSIDPVILGWTEMVLIFWFGGRALFKDLPSLLTYVKHIRNK